MSTTEYPAKVQQVVDAFERSWSWGTRDGQPGNPTLTVEATPSQYTPGDTMWVIRAERYAGTLAQHALTWYVFTRAKGRASLGGGWLTHMLGGTDTHYPRQSWRALRLALGMSARDYLHYSQLAKAEEVPA